MDIPEAPALKLHWAEKNLHTLDEEIRIFTETNPAILTVRKKPDEGVQVIRADFPQDRVPLDIGIIAGHAVMDMRCALNWLVCALWDESGREELGQAEFPIYKRRPANREFERKTKFLPREAKEIVEIMQPYRDGEKAVFQRLWILNQLANMDRHRGIIVRGAMVGFDMPSDPQCRLGFLNQINEHTIEVVVPIDCDDRNPNFTYDVIFRAEDIPMNVTPNTLWDIYHLIADGIFPMFTLHIQG